jgi:valyl-tRNA synthetase
MEKARASSNRQLNNTEFVSKAPAKVVESTRQNLAEYESKIERIRTTLDSLS